MRPVLYLDVDGVLWDIHPNAKPSWPQESVAIPAHGLEDFINWALEVFEVRWLTWWAPSGEMRERGIESLVNFTGVPAETWERVQPGKRWAGGGDGDLKTNGISWEEHEGGRPFAWVEDGILPQEERVLAARGFSECYYHTDVFENRKALTETHGKLKDRFGGREL